MPLLASAVQLDEPGVAAAWRSLWPDDRLLASMSFHDGALTFGDGELLGAAMTMPVPVPQDQPGSLIAGSWLWPDYGDAGDRHGAHVVVSASTSGPVLAAFQAMTRAAAAVARATGALGVYMGRGLGIRSDVFVGMATKLDVPAALWVDLRCVSAAQGCGLVTVGLAQFGLMELEVPVSSLPCGELRLRALNLIEWLIGQRPSVADGETVSVSVGSEPVRVSHALSSFGQPGLVYRLSGL